MDDLPDFLEKVLYESYQKAAQLGADWAVAQGECDSADDRKNDYLAQLKSTAEGKSDTEKERNARCSLEWQSFRSDLSDLKASALKLKIEYQTEVRKWETVRSLLASKNAERRLSV